MSEDVLKKHGGGMIGIASSTMSRYVEFNQCLLRLPLSTDIRVQYEVGCSIAQAHSNLCRRVMANKGIKWLLLLDDDHTFKPNILNNLLERDVHVVQPLCLLKDPPFTPVIHGLLEKGGHPRLGWDAIQGKSGMIQIEAAGHAGRLIRREVIEAMNPDWYRVGWDNPEQGASDIYFCKRLKELGILLHLDLDNVMGHINHFAVTPIRNKDNQYEVDIRSARM